MRVHFAIRHPPQGPSGAPTLGWWCHGGLAADWQEQVDDVLTSQGADWPCDDKLVIWSLAKEKAFCDFSITTYNLLHYLLLYY